MPCISHESPLPTHIMLTLALGQKLQHMPPPAVEGHQQHGQTALRPVRPKENRDAEKLACLHATDQPLHQTKPQQRFLNDTQASLPSPHPPRSTIPGPTDLRPVQGQATGLHFAANTAHGLCITLESPGPAAWLLRKGSCSTHTFTYCCSSLRPLHTPNFKSKMKEFIFQQSQGRISREACPSADRELSSISILKVKQKFLIGLLFELQGSLQDQGK